MDIIAGTYISNYTGPSYKHFESKEQCIDWTEAHPNHRIITAYLKTINYRNVTGIMELKINNSAE